MKKPFKSEKLMIEELSHAALDIRKLVRGLSIGQMIGIIRKQLGMSQRNLAEKAKIPQPTVSSIEQGKQAPNLSTLNKILEALSCDLILIPLLRESIDAQRRRQARRLAEKHVRYLRGTMNLEKQEPDAQFLEELIKQKEEEILHSKTKLWDK